MFTFLTAAAAAAAMYFFDPDSGRRRRALMRDKFAWLRDEAGGVREAAGGRAEHLRNRATGLMHETRSTVRNFTGKTGEGATGATDTFGQRTEQDQPASMDRSDTVDRGDQTVQRAA